MEQTDEIWLTPPAGRLTLGGDEVHLWRASLELGGHDSSSASDLLSADETARAGRFRFTRDRDRYVAARGLLRDILSRYTGVAPSQLRFSYGEHGKPDLSPECAATHVSFNLSHARTVVVYAIAKTKSVGVDVEFACETLSFLEMAGRFFSAEEYAALRALPSSQLAAGFFNCWTRKEAYVKGLGAGLSYPIDSFSVSLRPDEPAAFLRADLDVSGPTGWSLHSFVPAAGYVGALAVEGEVATLRRWHWSSFSA